MRVPILNKIIIFLIVGIRPLFGIAHCKYAISCTKFAAIALQERKLLPALWVIIKRVLSCNPWFSGKCDANQD